MPVSMYVVNVCVVCACVCMVRAVCVCHVCMPCVYAYMYVCEVVHLFGIRMFTVL